MQPLRMPKPQSPAEQLSRALSKTLRHAAEQQGFKISKDGYVRIDDLLAHQRYRSIHATRETIEQVVNDNAKKRFELSSDGSAIRAVQGHSLKVDVGQKKLSLADLPPVVVHGTNKAAWETIRSDGLRPMSRLHVHLAKGLAGQVTSGMRNSAQVYIYIDAPKAIADGMEFIESTNGVILTAGINGVILPKYFEKVTLRDGSILS